MNTQYTTTLVAAALAEDLGQGDITTDSLVPAGSSGQGRIIAKAAGIICGLGVAREVFRQINPKVSFTPLISEGKKIKPGQAVVRLKGPVRALLSGERVALNFLCHMSGIATATSDFVRAVKPHKTRILDTRKTTPLLRPLERYAVRCGGGDNHRFNLADAAMVKDNHSVFASKRLSLPQIVETIKAKRAVKVILEVDSLAQMPQALQSPADVILLDNMTPQQVKQAVRLRNELKAKVLLEASGGISLKNVRAYAAAGVERISIGSLTHSAQGLNMSLELDP